MVTVVSYDGCYWSVPQDELRRMKEQYHGFIMERLFIIHAQVEPTFDHTLQDLEEWIEREVYLYDFRYEESQGWALDSLEVAEFCFRYRLSNEEFRLLLDRVPDGTLQ